MRLFHNKIVRIGLAAGLLISGVAVGTSLEAHAALPTANLTLPTVNTQANPYTGTLTVEADAQDTTGPTGPTAGIRQAEAWLYAEDSLGSPTTFSSQNPNNTESKVFLGYLSLVSGTNVNGHWRTTWQIPTTGFADVTRDGDHTNPVPDGQTRRYTMPTGWYGIQTHWIDDEWLAAPGAPGFSQKNRIYLDTGTVAPPPPPAPTAVQNPSLESWLGAEPDCWDYSGWGNNTAVFRKVAGHTGSNGAEIAVSNRVSGDWKLMQDPSSACALQATPGKKYDLSAWYKSTTNQATFTAFTRTAATGQWNFWTDLPNVAVNSAWTQLTVTTPAVPVGVDRIQWGISVGANGTVTTDDYTFAENGGSPPPPPPPPPPSGGNLISNPSLETGAPDCFTLGGWGTVTATGALVSDAHTGTKAYKINVSSYTSGDRKLMVSENNTCAPQVTTGGRYDFSVWLKNSVPVNLTAFRFDTTQNQWVYWAEITDTGPSANWHQLVASTPVIPANTSRIVLGVSIHAVGNVTIDDWSLTDPSTTPPPPSQDSNGKWDVLTYNLNARAAHAVLLNNGKVLMIAGSGNDPALFNAGTFKTILWDPTTGTQTDIPTPDDMFCGGHVQLPDGKVLVVSGLKSYPTQTTSGEYEGAKFTYYFDPGDNQYHRLADLRHGHWYPSVIELGNGDVISVGGQKEDGTGNVEVEYFKSASKTWDNSAINQTWSYWGMYPDLRLLQDGRLLYTGNHVFGPGLPGSGSSIYNWQSGQITDIQGLRSKDLRDQAASGLLYPAQNQKFFIAGGGNIEGAIPAINSTDILDMKAANPAWTPGPDLPYSAMYISTVILPTGQTLLTGRGLYNRTDETNMAAMADMNMTHWDSVAADPISRGYHSTALLLPDGRVAALGNNPLVNSWEFRISIYTPSYVTAAGRPSISTAPTTASYGTSFHIVGSEPISEALLIKPAAVTHSSDPNMRAVKLPIAITSGNDVTVNLTTNPNIAPPGWYMLFVKDASGLPSTAKWIQIH